VVLTILLNLVSVLETHVDVPPFLLTACRRILGKLVVAQPVMKSPRNVSAECVALLICMLHVRDSDLGLETLFPEALAGYLQSPQLNAVIITQLKLRPLLPLFQSVIH
jgi:C4-dicarboxylate transporter